MKTTTGRQVWGDESLIEGNRENGCLTEIVLLPHGLSQIRKEESIL